MDEYLQPVGTVISIDGLKIEKALELACKLNNNSINFAKLIECRRNGDKEVIVFDVDVEVSQIQVHKIRPKERIAVTFYASDNIHPAIEALRSDFPRVPHLNLHMQEFPRNLCLYDQQYVDLKRRWTANRLVHDLRTWLALNAKGNLHQADQPLEPLLMNFEGFIILPHNLYKTENLSHRIYVLANLSTNPDHPFLVTTCDIPDDIPERPKERYVVSVHNCLPQVHGTIRRHPITLSGIADMTSEAGIDILEELRERLQQWKDEGREVLDSQLILLISFPKTRTKQGEVENTEIWAFKLKDKIGAIGEKIDLWKIINGSPGAILKPDLSQRGSNIFTDILNVSYELTRAMASEMNGRSVICNPNICAIGVGAFGSQLVINLARIGFGTWTLIDNDILMPHNVARHALTSSFVGMRKAEAIAYISNSVVSDCSPFSAIVGDVVASGKKTKEISDVFMKSDIILDMTASVTVARRISCDIDSKARRISLFLSPSGTDLILIAEDKRRVCSLDALEMQYYRSIYEDIRLENHLKLKGGSHRYGQSCSDITSTLPQDLIALHAALGARAIEKLIKEKSACISVWRADDIGNVERVDITTEPVIKCVIGKWNVITDKGVIKKLEKYRQAKLPNETGGILIGSFDMERKLLYLIDALPSPPDSEEWPTLYIRGCKDLQDIVSSIQEKTNGMVEYVGEWHSHPRKARTAPSDDDCKVFLWITNLMGQDGLPATMMIVGDGDQVSLFVGEMVNEENLIRG